MTHLLRLIFACFAFLTSIVFAAVPMQGVWKINGVSGEFPSPDAACAAAIAQYNRDNSSYSFALQTVAPNNPDGTVYFCKYRWELKSNGASNGINYVYATSTGGQCPANSVKMGSECVCQVGFEEKGGKCEAPNKCNGVIETCTASKGKRRSYMSPNSSDYHCLPPPDDFFWDQPKYPGCNIGCELGTGGIGIGMADDSGTMWYSGTGTDTGGTCFLGGTDDPTRPPDSPVRPPADPSDGKCAGFKGQVNGQDVCIPAQSAEGDKKTDSKTNSDGSSSKTESTTKCDGAQCTTTNTTTNKDANGNNTGTSTNVVVVPQGDYCQKNPSSQVCAAVTGAVKPGTGTGTGAGNGNCTGTDCSDTSGPGGPGAVGIPGTGGGGDIGELYKKKYPDGLVALWNQKSAELKNSGLAAVAGKLMPDVQDGGSPPVFDLDFNFGGRIGNLGGGNIAPDSNFWMIIKSIVILCSLILARKIIFGG